MLMLREDTEICNENDQSDPDYGPPETWGLWADRDTIELGPAFCCEQVTNLDHAGDTHESFEPTQADWADFHAWCREQDERNQDLEDARRVSEWQDMLEQSARFTDEDLMAAGLPVG